MLRELNRGGQIFFVHNRVEDIEKLAGGLRQIVPEAKLAVAHGQMHENDLEQVMLDFLDRRYDMLLATTIIESGLDIPNANTIFIDEADRYGLADLHQLRGRVGRYKHRAYCCLLIDPNKNLSPSAAKRLRAIEEFSDMGAGFAIAMRDLEIRGAGNILGAEQSGHIATIGYELYCDLLEQAVRRLKQLPPKTSIEVDVDLPGEGYIPRSYVPDMRLKIDLYRRLARVSNVSELADFRSELVDRFGPPPPLVQHLLEHGGDSHCRPSLGDHARFTSKTSTRFSGIRRRGRSSIGRRQRGAAAGGRCPKRLSAVGERSCAAGGRLRRGEIAVAAGVSPQSIIPPARSAAFAGNCLTGELARQCCVSKLWHCTASKLAG